MSRLTAIPGRLYRGEVSIDFTGRRKMWYSISGAILLISVLALLIRGLVFSVEFKGGVIYQFKAPAATITQVQDAVTHAGVTGATVEHVTASTSGVNYQVQTPQLSDLKQRQVAASLEKSLNVASSDMNDQFVGPTWGSQITGKAVQALIAFLIVIVLYLSVAFEWRMAAAALTALLHDIVITVGVYAIAGFEVSPATVIGFLTILGYSLYDTVVVFDKVRENTAGLLTTGKSSYSYAANLALNQTLVRSINTSVIALLPVAGILTVALTFLAPGNQLQDLSLVLLVGMLSGTYSSICIATPVLAQLKERDPQYKALAKRVAARARKEAEKTRTAGQKAAGDQGGDAGTPEPEDGAGAAEAVVNGVGAGTRVRAVRNRPSTGRPGGGRGGSSRRKRR